MTSKWDSMYMEMAEAAAKRSHAEKRKVGAIAVKDDNVIGIGINGTPIGWPDNTCEDEHGKTYSFTLHAETNMVSKMAKSSVSSDGFVAYCTCAPCLDCAKAMYQAGVSRVVYRDTYKTELGLEFLKSLNIEVEQWNV